MKARTVTHTYIGPIGASYINGLATRFRAACVCGWAPDISHVTRERAASAHRLHADTAAQDADVDTPRLADL